MLDAQEEAQSRTFAHEPGEGKAWWLGMVATIRANGAHFGRRSSVVAVALVILARACYEPTPSMPVACWRKRQAKATKCNPAKVAGSLS